MLSVFCDACQSIIPPMDRAAAAVTHQHRQYHLCAGCAAPVVTTLHVLGLPQELAIIR